MNLINHNRSLTKKSPLSPRYSRIAAVRSLLPGEEPFVGGNTLLKVHASRTQNNYVW